MKIKVLSFLPSEAIKIINSVEIDKLYEIRLRLGNQIFLNVSGNFYAEKYQNGFQLTFEELNQTIIRLTEHSVYAHANTIRKGYITTKSGVRVGICGECVVEDGEVKIIKQVTSLCIRVPHEIIGVSNNVYNAVYSKGLKNLLIISPPGCGKTTLLRDIIRNISENTLKNVLVVDERLEISGTNEKFNLGQTTDVLTCSTKKFGFEFGIKNMCPSVIAVDEIMNECDATGILTAVTSGAYVVATVHGKGVADVRKKQIFKSLFDNSVFDYAVIISEKARNLQIVEL